MTIQIKVTQLPDAKAIAAIHAASFYKGWDATSVKHVLRIKGTAAIVAYDNKKEMAGFALLRIAATELQIVSLAVHPEHRRQGMGAVLLDALLKEAFRRKVKAVTLKVNVLNKAAIVLYQKSGFLIVAQHKAYYATPDGTRIDAFELRRVLADTQEPMPFWDAGPKASFSKILALSMEKK